MKNFSEEGDTTFQIYYRGKFETHEGGMITYVGGEEEEIKRDNDKQTMTFCYEPKYLGLQPNKYQFGPLRSYFHLACLMFRLTHPPCNHLVITVKKKLTALKSKSELAWLLKSGHEIQIFNEFRYVLAHRNSSGMYFLSDP